VNKFGFGVQRAQAALNANPAAEFQFESTYVLVTVRQTQYENDSDF
jgi:hypothetical protein